MAAEARSARSRHSSDARKSGAERGTRVFALSLSVGDLNRGSGGSVLKIFQGSRYPKGETFPIRPSFRDSEAGPKIRLDRRNSSYRIAGSLSPRLAWKMHEQETYVIEWAVGR